MGNKNFLKVANSLRQYRRAELKDFEEQIGNNPIDKLYVDPLSGDAILETIMSNNTTFIVGRKGTGKSTIFAKAQSEIRKKRNVISIYIDVKSLYEIINSNETPVSLLSSSVISPDVYLSHMLRKNFLAAIISELIRELNKAVESLSLIDRWRGRKKEYQEVLGDLAKLSLEVSNTVLSEEEVPILQLISSKTYDFNSRKEKNSSGVKIKAKVSTSGAAASTEASSQVMDETLSDNEVYVEYSDVLLRTFPFAKIIQQVQDLLSEVGMKRLVVFFDDFSEIEYLNQRLFVDVILAPLNNSSDEKIKFKIAGYPGRIYYGKIDPSKVDTIHLDFYSLYKANEFQEAENSAVDYTRRLLLKRFAVFQVDFSEVFDLSSATADEYIRLIFQVTFNVPRIMGYILQDCYLDKISKGAKITPSALKLAAQKYYENIISHYFDRMVRFALEPYDRKLDRHIQHQLLKHIVEESRTVKRRITSKEVGGTYFDGLHNPPVSHFAISPNIEDVFSSLELNFLVTKYHEMRDKDGKDVSIYALFYGLCESERFQWGYPKTIKDYRKYFIQRCFNYNGTINEFLSKNQTIRCDHCGACFPIDTKSSLELYRWQCPECREGKCAITNLSTDFEAIVNSLQKEMALEKVELDILYVLKEERKAMKASDISVLLDLTYQLVGKRTTKLQQLRLIDKEDMNGTVKSSITERAIELYFTS